MVRNLTCRDVLRRVTEMTCRRCVKTASINTLFVCDRVPLEVKFYILCISKLKKHTSFHLLIRSLQYCSKIPFIVETLTTLLFSTF